MYHLQILLKDLMSFLLQREVNPQRRNGLKSEHRTDMKMKTTEKENQFSKLSLDTTRRK